MSILDTLLKRCNDNHFTDDPIEVTSLELWQYINSFVYVKESYKYGDPTDEPIKFLGRRLVVRDEE